MRVFVKGKGVLQGGTVLDPVTRQPRCHRFSGIPYCLPPNGARRWRKPEPLPAGFSYGSEQRPGQYTKLSAACPQAPIFGAHTADEDSLQLNIWSPLDPAPPGGWPVFFYIHGGFLQFGSNTSDNPSALISETDVKCIVVSPSYRLGIFGFLASKEVLEFSSAANFGFWDQRAALDWTFDHIEQFGGNKDNITVGGISAGSYSAFHQLAHDIASSSSRQVIRRVIQWSNGCGVQPKTVDETQEQFDNLIMILGIPPSLSGLEKIERLQQISSSDLMAAVSQLDQQFFRPILDGDFMPEDLFPSIFDGRFGQRMQELNIQTIIGDLTQEFQVYKTVFPPNSFDSLIDRLSWDYPRRISEAICAPFDTEEPRSDSEWMEIFGHLYADMQIHSTMRGLIDSIAPALPISSINRYRIDWVTESVGQMLPKEVGATHGTDMSIWFFGNGGPLTDPEQVLIKEWLKPMAAFLKGERFEWGTKHFKEVRYITNSGAIEIKEDEVWDQKLPLWNLTKKITQSS